MLENGQPYVFRVEDLQGISIDSIIDVGRRFVIKAGLVEGIDVYDKPEDVLNGEVSTVRKT